MRIIFKRARITLRMSSIVPPFIRWSLCPIRNADRKLACVTNSELSTASMQQNCIPVMSLLAPRRISIRKTRIVGQWTKWKISSVSALQKGQCETLSPKRRLVHQALHQNLSTSLLTNAGSALAISRILATATCVSYSATENLANRFCKGPNKIHCR